MFAALSAAEVNMKIDHHRRHQISVLVAREDGVKGYGQCTTPFICRRAGRHAGGGLPPSGAGAFPQAVCQSKERARRPRTPMGHLNSMEESCQRLTADHRSRPHHR